MKLNGRIFIVIFVLLTSNALTATFPVSIDPAQDDKIRVLSDSDWYWSAVKVPDKEMESIGTPNKYTLRFRNDGTIAIVGDCNRVAGTFSLSEGTISIKPTVSTLAACGPDSKSDQLIALIGQAEKFVVSPVSLVLVLKDKGLMIFRPPNPAELCGGKATAVHNGVTTLDPAISAELDKILLDFVTGPSISPGASMYVMTPKGSYHKSIGISDVSACAELPVDSPFQIGSNTKMMTSAMILQLQERGKLSLSDPIGKWLPDLAAKIPNSDRITIDMLLTHTSGIADYFDVGEERISSGTGNKAMLTRGFTPEEIVLRVANFGKPDFAPGEAGKWKYSNTGYILLGLIIEKATGKSYEDNLRSRILKPLKLKSTYLQKGQPATGALPVAYYEMPFKFTTSEWNASQGWAAGAVVSTSEDFATFLRALFNGKLFKKPATLALMRSYPPAGSKALGEGTVYCHGMLENQGVLGHGGQTLGFLSDGGYIPEIDTTFVIWSNAGSGKTSRLVVPAIAKVLRGEK